MPSKTEKFKENKTLTNVIEHDDKDAKKKLAQFLDAKKETILELACGGGDYTIELAKMFKDKNFIGVDIQGERIWLGAKKAKQEKINNVIFFRSYIDNLLEFFNEKSIAEIWITFPDPYPRKKKYIKRRLTSSGFLRIYQKLLKTGGVVHLKTDAEKLFDYSVEEINDFGGTIVESIKDIYSKKKIDPTLEIKTFFENKHLKAGRKINYLRFKLDNKVIKQ